uniref:FBD domain-containing protein n=1 Tax=Oryza barthii TaxID=65489 RepID=A0A0D3HAS9_9ORYZ
MEVIAEDEVLFKSGSSTDCWSSMTQPYRSKAWSVDLVTPNLPLEIDYEMFTSRYLRRVGLCNGELVIEGFFNQLETGCPVLEELNLDTCIIIDLNDKEAHFDANDMQEFLPSLSRVKQLKFRYNGEELHNHLNLVQLTIGSNSKWCPKFFYLVTLTLGQCCLHSNFYALIVFLQNTPRLEKLTLKLSDDHWKTSETLIGEIRSFTCEHLTSVEVTCSEDDPMVRDVVDFFAVQMCVLSQRWRNLWRSMPGINIDCKEFEVTDKAVFIEFVNRLLKLRDPVAPISKFSLWYSMTGSGCDTVKKDTGRWISNALQKQAWAVEIYVEMFYGYLKPLVLDHSVFTSTYLQIIWFSNVILDDGFFKQLEAGCPALEDLFLDECFISDVEISSQTLKVLTIKRADFSTDPKTSISTPSATSLTLSDPICGIFVLKDMASVVTASVKPTFMPLRKCITGLHQYLLTLSGVKNLEFFYPKKRTISSSMKWTLSFHKLFSSPWCQKPSQTVLRLFIDSKTVTMMVKDLHKLFFSPSLIDDGGGCFDPCDGRRDERRMVGDERMAPDDHATSGGAAGKSAATCSDKQYTTINTKSIFKDVVEAIVTLHCKQNTYHIMLMCSVLLACLVFSLSANLLNFVQLTIEDNLQLCPKFNNLVNLTLGEWCLHANFYALIVFIENSPRLEKLALKLYEFGQRTSKRTIVELNDRLFTCGHLKIVEVICFKNDPLANHVVDFLFSSDSYQTLLVDAASRTCDVPV